MFVCMVSWEGLTTHPGCIPTQCSWVRLQVHDQDKAVIESKCPCVHTPESQVARGACSLSRVHIERPSSLFISSEKG